MRGSTELGQLWDEETASDPWKAWLPFLVVPAQMPTSFTRIFNSQVPSLPWGSAVDKVEPLTHDRMGSGCVNTKTTLDGENQRD